MADAASPFDPLNALAAWRQWAGLMQPGGSAAPPSTGSFVQPILPGWTFNLNSHNSSAPQTEADVVARHSYGRQIGRMADAVRALVLAQRGETAGEAEAEALQVFLDTWDEVEQVKTESAKRRLGQLSADLDHLQQHDAQAYRQLVAELQQALAKRR